jgi:hypothetical protein
VVDSGEIATQVRASLAVQSDQPVIRSWESEHHELPGLQLTLSARTRAAIDQADRAARLWLRGYLPYEVDRLTAVARSDLLASSTPALASRLLASPPLIPPTGSPPPQGRLVALNSTLAPGARRARVYVEIGYGLERYGLLLTLTRGGRKGWLVAGVQG